MLFVVSNWQSFPLLGSRTFNRGALTGATIVVPSLLHLLAICFESQTEFLAIVEIWRLTNTGGTSVSAQFLGFFG